MSDWYAEQLARARQRRYAAGWRYPRGRKFVAGEPVSPPMPTPDKPMHYGSVVAMEERDAARRQHALAEARRLLAGGS